ncbi:MAG: AAA family ATPase [bacterium]|nr:AAA family ATPase [bacterium]MDO8496386.1 AAA family ATPase [bacterium]
MVVTVSGASGAGKTTIEKGLLKRLANVEVIVSVTTRDRRDTDNQNEYKYVSKLWFRFLDKLGAFLWTVNIHGNWYGTLESSLRKALKSYDDISIMILVPDRVKNLWDYARERGSEEFVLSFYILSPSPEILRKRLQSRGDSVFEIVTRIKDCEKWDAEALASDLPYIFIRNDDRVENTVENIISYINEGIEDQLF